ncbi:hypothetical protein NO559_04910 [Dasania sp. GY-MA-18]|uniref:Toxin-antitoxin system YwqK family antitoxin n=1 Tax=Dasania phycosphaerae TaxID=2950436 RepID=A0A9J6RK08_9GAMM|nr:MULTISPECIES: hypothetical protein [Dasania]MCR8922099.1 hypothetical protein [Dasania sp. GY-MA-18]MCZ0864527.1 hypothetical protein [Dasania phycosphaerae]MCZ0868255.1 hypothetical protein [Dasania phycosphaerae]
MKAIHFFTRLISVSLLCAHIHAQAQADFNCPEGTKKIGVAPPSGTQVKCLNEQGERHGPFWMWYSNGQMMQALQFKNGLEHGKQQAWFPNGNLMMEGVSIDGSRNKGFKYFNYYGEPVDIEFKTAP